MGRGGVPAGLLSVCAAVEVDHLPKTRELLLAITRGLIIPEQACRQVGVADVPTRHRHSKGLVVKRTPKQPGTQPINGDSSIQMWITFCIQGLIRGYIVNERPGIHRSSVPASLIALIRLTNALPCNCDSVTELTHNIAFGEIQCRQFFEDPINLWTARG